MKNIACIFSRKERAMEEKTYLDKAIDLVNDHPIAISAGFCALATFGCYKFTQKLISDAIYSANIRTVEYILRLSKR